MKISYWDRVGGDTLFMPPFREQLNSVMYFCTVRDQRNFMSPAYHNTYP